MIRLQHTVFALPFAIMGLITATGQLWPEPSVWLWVLVAMVSARTAAMSFNRLVDQRIDGENPRTKERSLPAGRLSRPFVWIVTIVCAVVFVLAAGFLNRLCLLLSVPTLVFLLGYSFAKRFTSWSHIWLGAALALAPIGAWVAAVGEVAWPPVVLGIAVLFWVAGFDVIYSLQDLEFDRSVQLRSLPAALGADAALRAARVFHLIAFAGFLAFSALAGGGPLRYGAAIAGGVLLAWQHRLVSPDDLSRVDAAFFTANGVLAVLMSLVFVFAKMPFAL
ncbi:MAG: UbiA family prenyltransferase [bacterium]|nr:UbiA family prenyltransferase [bacterium]